MDFRRLCICSCWRFNFWQHRNHKQFSEFEDSTYLDSSIDQSDLKDLKKELNKLGVSFSVMKNKETQNYEVFFQAKDIKVMEYAFKQVIAKENKKEKESILKQIKKYKDLSKNKDKTKEKVKRKVKEKVKPNKKDMTREI